MFCAQERSQSTDTERVFRELFCAAVYVMHSVWVSQPRQELDIMYVPGSTSPANTEHCPFGSAGPAVCTRIAVSGAFVMWLRCVRRRDTNNELSY